MLEGWRNYRKGGSLKLPEEVRGATELYREASDECRDFLKESVIRDGSNIASTQLYQAFKAWFAETNGRQQPIGQKTWKSLATPS